MELSELNAVLGDPLLDSVTFLNEVAGRFPDAVSFAAGSPCEDFYDVDALDDYQRRFREYLTDELGMDRRRVIRTLFQYGRTKGIVHELIARHLVVDEDIDVDPDSIVVTVGAQEAILLVLRALRRDDRDVALAVSPTYMGFTGAARLLDLPVVPVATGELGVDFDHLSAQLASVRGSGLRPRCLYVVPDFANPTGISMDTASRRRLLEVSAREDLLLLEDNPYGQFPGHGERLPTLKSLDQDARVVYLGSMAKTTMPGARVGFVIADQPVTVDRRRVGCLADELAKIKSMVTVNTSPLSQAVVGGQLLAHEFSLAKANEPVRAVYRRNMDAMLRGLHERFAGTAVRWNVPTGGFFIVLTVPFRVSDALVEHSARQHRVLWTPMAHFYSGGDEGAHQLRLSFSSLSCEQIDLGLDRLAGFVAEQTQLAVHASA
ncbi:PLP-dependent aminotransferase family protein (plasmid) [Streptomyces sp. NBC_01340]|uniref:aminotransferase-like domain-containing protein n=1 Tax=unclassified Streptomyces TaxID=2593676 RepID=UPI00225863C1|nr:MULTISPECIES: PLP-dependent aminotransferase family protein [unclassified Streptomyces]MCX4460729.1 PLP-dependent aminotransferase family protein [Streptomyces sp. NBC_01719]MCX4499941.1 PLP-dependent aminotransferase family protein [Streptomyces sp. NBC_01728]WSI45067.1 PLP-dependent aminotransferase family protein [Streptomyces sp. NBC_01340]